MNITAITPVGSLRAARALFVGGLCLTAMLAASVCKAPVTGFSFAAATAKPAAAKTCTCAHCPGGAKCCCRCNG